MIFMYYEVRSHSPETEVVYYQMPEAVDHGITSFSENKKPESPLWLSGKKRGLQKNSFGHERAHAHFTAHVTTTHHAF